MAHHSSDCDDLETVTDNESDAIADLDAGYFATPPKLTLRQKADPEIDDIVTPPKLTLWQKAGPEIDDIATPRKTLLVGEDEVANYSDHKKVPVAPRKHPLLILPSTKRKRISSEHDYHIDVAKNKKKVPGFIVRLRRRSARDGHDHNTANEEGSTHPPPPDCIPGLPNKKCPNSEPQAGRCY